MTHKNLKRKVQVVTIAKNNNDPSALLLKTIEERGAFWQNVTGGVEDDEKFITGAIRELHEETGIEADTLIRLGITFKFKSRWKDQAREKCYLNMIPTEIDIVLDPKEHDEYKWIKLNDLDENSYGHNSNYAAVLMAKEHV